jgi:hypothetical protein
MIQSGLKSESPGHIRTGVHESNLFSPIVIRSDSEVVRFHQEDISRAITRPIGQGEECGIASRGDIGDWSAVRVREDDKVGSFTQLWPSLQTAESILHIGDETQS